MLTLLGVSSGSLLFPGADGSVREAKAAIHFPQQINHFLARGQCFSLVLGSVISDHRRSSIWGGGRSVGGGEGSRAPPEWPSLAWQCAGSGASSCVPGLPVDAVDPEVLGRK